MNLVSALRKFSKIVFKETQNLIIMWDRAFYSKIYDSYYVQKIRINAN